MRLLSVTTIGIGGLRDGEVVLPQTPVAALAGGNGTGKSKLLACLLSPWTGLLPAPRSGHAAEVSVRVKITAKEQQALGELSTVAGWGVYSAPETFSVITRYSPLVGLAITSEPPAFVLQQFAKQPNVLKLHPSLDVLFLPAERRLLPANTTGIDLNQLSDDLALQMSANARNSVQTYGRLDDAEFEQFAKALCVAGQLQDDPDVDLDDEEPQESPRLGWDAFKDTVDSLIAPKRLLPLTRQHPENLRITTPDGSQHAVQDLSSGERQALIVISRILRAGTGHGVVMIDEPDAYLHPNLSRRLAVALEQATGAEGQLVMATHSPAILDTLAPSSILRLSHARPPARVADEAERLEVYRDAGFKASALTLSDLLVITEGEADATLLPLLLPDLARATVRSAGGRRAVLSDLERLRHFDLPVLGVVDGDVLPEAPPREIETLLTTWAVADIEGVFLSDDEALTVMLDRGLLKRSITAVAQARGLLEQLLLTQEENVVAEIAQRLLREKAGMSWPTPKGDQPLARLGRTLEEMVIPSRDDLEKAAERGRRVWADSADNRWSLVRGKYVLNQFAQDASVMASGQALLEAVARARPPLSHLAAFKTSVAEGLARAG